MATRFEAATSGPHPGLTGAQACDDEPIHIPGAVQPHGALLIVDGETVIAAAGSISTLLATGRDPVGLPLANIVGRSKAALIARSDIPDAAEPIHVATIPARDRNMLLDVLAHRMDGLLLVEIEPALAERPSAARVFARIQGAGARIRNANSPEAVFAATAAEVRDATGFDRVLVYRFEPDGCGEVVGEAKAADMGSFLGHHFPAGDIPRQARRLYLRNPIRVIPDAGYVPSPLASALAKLDLSNCSLRSVSTAHVQYLKNMGVGASMSVSLVRDGQLWGLIACHNRGPRLVPFETREACKHVGAELMRHLREIEASAEAQAQRRLTRDVDRLTASIGGRPDIVGGLTETLDQIVASFCADAVVIRAPDLCLDAGALPEALDRQKLVDGLARRFGQGVHATSDIGAVERSRWWRQGLDGGVLFASTGSSDGVAIALLRGRTTQTIGWAGDPSKPLEIDPTTMLPSPRRSFALWQQTQAMAPPPWTAPELDAVERLARQLERLLRQHRITMLQAELIHVSRVSAMGALASMLAHELNQPLTAIANYSQAIRALLRADAGEAVVTDALTHLDQMTNAAVRAGKMVRSLRATVSNMPVQRTGVRLDQVVANAIWLALPDAHVRRIKVDVAIPEPARNVLGDPVQIEQVLTNLIRNAAEAMAAVRKRRLAIGATVKDGMVEVRVADSGPGLSKDSLARLFAPFSTSKRDGMGLGLSICRTIVERHGGRIWAEQEAGGGAVFSFTLPLRDEDRGEQRTG
jgi:light-regulated signal transduction histidine kinase (bacteriophytochrome)